MLSCMPWGNWERIHSSTIENGNGNISVDLDNLKKSIQQNVQVPDALRVAPRVPQQKVNEPITTVSGEFFWEKRWEAPWDKLSFDKTWHELNYLMIYKKLSYKEYYELFGWFVNLKQWNFWDCYLVSSIKSLARANYFDTLMMTSIKKNNDGSFDIYLPLWSPSWNKIHISKEELNLAKINWSLWYKILEVWFAKELLLRKNWLLLHVGDMPDIKLTKESMNSIVWWSSYDALAVLLWYSNVKRQLINNNLKREKVIINELKKFNPKNWDLIVISSNRRPNWIPSTQKTYKVEGRSMYYHHAYSLYAVEKRWSNIESVIIEDPTDNSKKIKLSIFSFMSSFYQMTTCRPLEWFLSLS